MPPEDWQAGRGRGAQGRRALGPGAVIARSQVHGGWGGAGRSLIDLPRGRQAGVEGEPVDGRVAFILHLGDVHGAWRV